MPRRRGRCGVCGAVARAWPWGAAEKSVAHSGTHRPTGAIPRRRRRLRRGAGREVPAPGGRLPRPARRAGAA